LRVFQDFLYIKVNVNVSSINFSPIKLLKTNIPLS
jgi:hypothetical protein